jgi:tetratricopeptide repeat protein 30
LAKIAENCDHNIDPRQDFVNAANCYEQLTMFYPEEDDYKVYYAQALYQACLYEEAMKVTVQIENPELQGQVKKATRPK